MLVQVHKKDKMWILPRDIASFNKHLEEKKISFKLLTRG